MLSPVHNSAFSFLLSTDIIGIWEKKCYTPNTVHAAAEQVPKWIYPANSSG